jgi:hypothetical protein
MLTTSPPLEDFSLATGCTLAGLGVCDALVSNFFLSKLQASCDKTRFFILHALINWVVAAMCTTSLMATVTDPADSNNPDTYLSSPLFARSWTAIVEPNNHWPTVLITAIHLYHVIPGLFCLSAADRFHHLLFCPAIIAPGLLLRSGVLRNAVGWLICGAPGALDYTLLVGVKLGHVSKLQQKAINRQVALWLRIPGLLFVAFCGYQSSLYDRDASWVTRMVMRLACAFIAYNGLYYGDMSIRNHTKWELHERETRRCSGLKDGAQDCAPARSSENGKSSKPSVQACRQNAYPVPVDWEHGKKN